jgi:hypothetical protein
MYRGGQQWQLQEWSDRLSLGISGFIVAVNYLYWAGVAGISAVGKNGAASHSRRAIGGICAYWPLETCQKKEAEMRRGVCFATTRLDLQYRCWRKKEAKPMARLQKIKCANLFSTLFWGLCLCLSN